MRKREGDNGAITHRGRFTNDTRTDFVGTLTIDFNAPGDESWVEHIDSHDPTHEEVYDLDWSSLPHSGDDLDDTQAEIIASYMANRLKSRGLRLQASSTDIAQSAITRLKAQPSVDRVNQPLILRAIGREALNMRNAELGLRHEDVKALGILWANKRCAETALGRGVTRSESDQLALKTRDQWPQPRHRPRMQFHASSAPPHVT
jgi:hypothetical protein